MSQFDIGLVVGFIVGLVVGVSATGLLVIRREDNDYNRQFGKRTKD
jgi:hypothetical protein